jgi:hypothetical protein
VQVTARKLGRRQAVGPHFPAAGVCVRNRRDDRMFDIEVTRFVMHGKEIELEIDFIDVHPTTRDSWYRPQELPSLAFEPDQVLSIFPKGLPDIPADYVSVAYTDSSGRRWNSPPFGRDLFGD